MPLSLISSIGGGLNQSINPKPKYINVLTVAGPFSTIILGTSPNYYANVSNRIISGNIYTQGDYNIKCSAWITEGTMPTPSTSLGMICDSNINTYCSSLFRSSAAWFDYNGNQQPSSGALLQYDSNGAYIANINYTQYNENSIVYGDYIDFIFPTSILINTYSFIQRQNALYRTPRNLYILGSNNGSNWILISQYENNNVSSGTWTNIYLKSSLSINPYRYIRMSISTLQPTNSGGLWNIAEINISYNIA